MNEIISNGIQSIVNLARNDIYKKVMTKTESDIYLNVSTGEHKHVTKECPPINHVLFDLDSLIRMIAECDSANEPEAMIATFVSPYEIVAIIDYSGFRANTVKVPLTQSPILNFLRSGCEGVPKDVIRNLKYNLKSAASGLEILPALQSLKFEVNKTAQHDTAHYDEAVSQSLKAKVTGATEIPDWFEVTFEMYPSMESQLEKRGEVTVKMELHVDPSAGTVSFRPFPGEIEAVIIEGVEIIRNEIAERLHLKELDLLAELVLLGRP